MVYDYIKEDRSMISEERKGMRILNFGSLNVDYVYNVDHFVRPGETLAALSRDVKAGGKGLNQSVALARAGAPVCHAGCLGAGGEILKDMLDENGVDTSLLLPVDEMQGHTVIQVDRQGENSILLYGGSNRCIPDEYIRRVIGAFGEGDWLILQNEINGLPLITELAARQGMHIVLNPSPYDEGLKKLDLSAVEWLLINEIEAGQISGEEEPERVWENLHGKYPGMSVLMTLGSRGSIAFRAGADRTDLHREEAVAVKAVDTTAAGDTYTGYFIAGLTAGDSLDVCMKTASRAAAIAVTRPGAAESIPWKKDLA